MTVAELIAILEDANPESEVRIADQPQWPFEYALDQAVVVDYPDEPEAEDEDAEPFRPDDAHVYGQQIVYLATGRQINYLHHLARVELGWTRGSM
jgi:hypothetical protein